MKYKENGGIRFFSFFIFNVKSMVVFDLEFIFFIEKIILYFKIINLWVN